MIAACQSNNGLFIKKIRIIANNAVKGVVAFFKDHFQVHLAGALFQTIRLCRQSTEIETDFRVRQKETPATQTYRSMGLFQSERYLHQGGSARIVWQAQAF